MKVKDVMTPKAHAIWLTESLVDAAKMMWDNDCGILPVIKDGRKVVGLITDRDICMAVGFSDVNPSSVSIEEVMTGEVYAVKADEDINAALRTMQERKVRRLPVLDENGELEGIVSLNDIVLKARKPEGKGADFIPYADVVKTYQSICEHWKPAAAAAAASA